MQCIVISWIHVVTLHSAFLVASKTRKLKVECGAVLQSQSFKATTYLLFCGGQDYVYRYMAMKSKGLLLT